MQHCGGECTNGKNYRETVRIKRVNLNSGSNRKWLLWQVTEEMLTILWKGMRYCMGRYRKRICGILFAAALLCGSIMQPVTAGMSGEMDGTEGLFPGYVQSGDVQEDEAAPESGDAQKENAESDEEQVSSTQPGQFQENENVWKDEAAGESDVQPGGVQENGTQPEGEQTDGMQPGNMQTEGSRPTGGKLETVSEEGTVTAQKESLGQDGRTRVSTSMDAETAEWVEAAGEALTVLAAEREIMALVYLSDEYPVRTSPDYEGGTAVTVLSGQTVNILDVYVDDNMEIWYYVGLEYKGQEIQGYVPRMYLASSDSRFLEWEEMYGMNFQDSAYATDGEEKAAYPDIDQFPESYRQALLALKQKHPNWRFVKMNTGLDWDNSVYQQLQNGKSLIEYTQEEWAKEGLYDDGQWYYASEAALEVYMDPRNGLTENGIFQFEQLTYNEECHTLEAVTAFLRNTFMTDSKPAPGTNTTYAQLFWDIGREDGRKVSPFHLAARVLQEQGKGTSPLISGTYKGYEGYYNFFNIKASGTTSQQIYENGLKYAKEQGWYGVEKALRGGADFISANYIRKGQDTLYLQKFNVNPNGTYAPYTHQYMQNIMAPTSEAFSMKRLYESASAVDSTFVFKIPVYENMPEAPCTKPSASTNVVLKLPSGYSDTTVWLDGVAYQGERRDSRLIVEAPDGKAGTAVVYQYNASGVPVGMAVWSLRYNGVAYTATKEPGLADLLTYHGFSIRVTGKTGIRFKTGISAELRGKLISAGINGYKLKEYGTLVMNNANRAQYPMIRGGAKVAGGISYGMDSSGNMQDVVFETVDGRYRYTSVLVGLPVEQYKTEYAFRGYIVLEKDGVETTLYGPVVARSIYNLAQQLLSQGSYPAGSAAETFLKKLVSDADALSGGN